MFKKMNKIPISRMHIGKLSCLLNDIFLKEYATCNRVDVGILNHCTDTFKCSYGSIADNMQTQYISKVDILLCTFIRIIAWKLFKYLQAVDSGKSSTLLFYFSEKGSCRGWSDLSRLNQGGPPGAALDVPDLREFVELKLRGNKINQIWKDVHDLSQ